MLNTTIILFALAAIVGVLLLLKVLKGESTAKPLVFLHGALSATGLVLLTLYVVENYEGGPVLSLGLFIIAALGGFILFAMDLSKKKVSKTLALIHGGAAVIAFLLLLMFAFSL